MKKVKYRLFLDHEKEEKWINDMAVNGWNLEKFAFSRFIFTKGEPGKFVYRNELISGMSTTEKKDYFEILKDSGITIIQEFGGWIYMEKAVSDGPLEIFTDIKSKLDYYTRILSVFLLLFFVNICLGLSNLNFFSNQSNLGFINSTMGFINIFVAALIAYPIIKIIYRKRHLQRKHQFFE
ncbi:DUF2812 domain-containing protein [Niallia taxi]|uniref:DUF2812 domain-containing protein n=1 Tax=Niallia taxi TaxID=2499688 RepID=UPI002E1AEE9A|nr:DUF2812 domain-containing protein [Niallia taxi]MED4122358.1 DUF2812 domain-containing protein [Niallia taxi]